MLSNTFNGIIPWVKNLIHSFGMENGNQFYHPILIREKDKKFTLSYLTTPRMRSRFFVFFMGIVLSFVAMFSLVLGRKRTKKRKRKAKPYSGWNKRNEEIKNVVGWKWILHIERNLDGTRLHYKVLPVAKRVPHWLGIHFHATYILVLKPISTRWFSQY